MKKLFLTAAAALLSLFCYSQDLIIKRNADEIQAKVLEVTSTEIKYKKSSNPNGPTYSIPRNEVFLIKYANGDKDVITTQEAVAPQPAQQSSSSGFVSKGKYKVDYLSPGGKTLSDVVGLTDYERTMAAHFSLFGELSYPIVFVEGLNGKMGVGFGALLNGAIDRETTVQMGLIYNHRSFTDVSGDQIMNANYLTMPIVFRWYPFKRFFWSAGFEVDFLVGGNMKCQDQVVMKGSEYLDNLSPAGCNLLTDIGYGPVAIRLRTGLVNLFSSDSYFVDGTSRMSSIGLIVSF